MRLRSGGIHQFEKGEMAMWPDDGFSTTEEGGCGTGL